MIVEQRRYQLAPGAVAEYLERYQAAGLDIHRRHLGEPLGCFTTDVGRLGQVIHTWRFDDYADREHRRRDLGDDPAWAGYLRTVVGLVQTQTSEILIPAPFIADRLGSGTAS